MLHTTCNVSACKERKLNLYMKILKKIKLMTHAQVSVCMEGKLNFNLEISKEEILLHAASKIKF